MLYAHFDVETNGPCLLENSMIQLGIIFTDEDGKEVDNFLVNIKEIDDMYHERNEDTMNNFWYKDDEMRLKFNDIIENSIIVEKAMERLAILLFKYQDRRIKWIAKPSSFY